MVQDSYSSSHVIRDPNGGIVLFESYQDQGAHEHGTADQIPKDGTWRDVPGVASALRASIAILTLYKQGAPVEALEELLRNDLYRSSDGAAESQAGGTATQYLPKPKHSGKFI